MLSNVTFTYILRCWHLILDTAIYSTNPLSFKRLGPVLHYGLHFATFIRPVATKLGVLAEQC